ncbi:molybdate transport system regulatory protein [Pseudoxanthobacter soli DSM 19599]|uniref:Molybdate transport system regulatory protein n=2 Tax=Pseudoxanthobacter TaxID=433838 RepID=A0A1M7Z8D7_9HYPH|nr:LysR family transcriptional regulator [Pseudoxanthobacter soli]SHO60976.1 molybdate transport system regulatory protein [Pseudoxanthobacter soli DSM 19599]
MDATLRIRIHFGDRGFFGPGKAQLLELIASEGSIAAAGRAMGMSYRRAWLLVEDMNALFDAPLVAAQHGGQGGGGAVVTPEGMAVLARYRAVIEKAEAAAGQDIAFLVNRLSP